jgi:hypothetical protein
MFIKIFNIFFTVLFILSALLQYNDPDPYIWVPIYLYGTWICIDGARNRYHPKAYLAGVIVYITYAAYLFFDQTGVLNWWNLHQAENIVQEMEPDKPWIEETREFGGLILLILVILVNWIYFRNRLKKLKNI